MKSRLVVLYSVGLAPFQIRSSIVVKYFRLSRGRPGFDSPLRSSFLFYYFFPFFLSIQFISIHFNFHPFHFNSIFTLKIISTLVSNLLGSLIFGTEFGSFVITKNPLLNAFSSKSTTNSMLYGLLIAFCRFCFAARPHQRSVLICLLSTANLTAICADSQWATEC